MSGSIRTILAAMALSALLWGCVAGDDWQSYPGGPGQGGEMGGGGGSSEPATEPGDVPEVDTPETADEDDFVENSDFPKSVSIVFDGASASISGIGDGVSVDVGGAGVTVTSSVKGVEYTVSGATSDGFLKFYSDYKFKLVLKGVSITNPSGPAINIQTGKRCFVVLAEGTTNTLADGTSYAAAGGEDMKGCLFSEGELIFSGTGVLTVAGNYKHAVCSDDYVRVRDGRIVVTAAASDGIHTNDAFIMDGGSVSVVSTGDGIECGEGYIYIKGGEISVESGDDGIVASYDGDDPAVSCGIYITGGSIVVKTTAQKGHALKSTGDVSIAGGTHTINVAGAASKGINADGNVAFSGGKTTIDTSGNAIYDSGDTSSSAGVKCGGDFGITAGVITIKSSGSGGKGINSGGGYVQEGGTVSVTTTGSVYRYSGSLTSSPKGIKAQTSVGIREGLCTVVSAHEGIESLTNVTIGGGTVEVTASDDAMNVSSRNGSIVINGGRVFCYSTSNDGIDSNGTITITGGTVIASGTTSPEEGFDCDQNTFKITGGTVIGTGGATSTPTSSVCTQSVVVYGGSGSSGEAICISDASDDPLLVYKLPRSYNQMSVLLSHPDLAKGSFMLSKGGTATGGEEFHGYFDGALYSGGSATAFTISSMVTAVGSSSGGGGGGGPQPGGGGGWRP